MNRGCGRRGIEDGLEDRYNVYRMWLFERHVEEGYKSSSICMTYATYSSMGR